MPRHYYAAIIVISHFIELFEISPLLAISQMPATPLLTLRRCQSFRLYAA
jgi:hypothetical protein